MINENKQVILISKYIVEKYNIYEPAKLQKILYFLYLDYLKDNNKKLFDDKFEAWIYGPVVSNVYSFIKIHDYKFDSINEELDNDTKYFIDEKIKKYLKLDTFELIKKAHNTEPWKKARKGLSYDEISHKKITFSSLKEYAQNKSRRA